MKNKSVLKLRIKSLNEYATAPLKNKVPTSPSSLLYIHCTFSPFFSSFHLLSYCKNGVQEEHIITHAEPVGHFPFRLLRGGSKGTERPWAISSFFFTFFFHFHFNVKQSIKYYQHQPIIFLCFSNNHGVGFPVSGRDRGGFNRDSRLFWGGFPNFYGGYGGYGGYFNNPFDPRYSFGQGRGFPFNPPFGNGVFNNPFGGGFNTGTGGGFVGGIPNIGGGVRVPW